MIYFAYGSNLNKHQMSIRCPKAKALGAGYLTGWRLVFRGVADIEENHTDPTVMLPVGFWEITDDCLQALDFYEGYPRLYRRVNINGMMTYRMNYSGYSAPHKSYFDAIRQGYHDFGLDESELYHAQDWAEELEEAM